MWDFLQEQGLQQGIHQAILLGALVAARVAPVVYLVPYLGGQTMPQTVKLGICAALAALVYPAVWQSGAAAELPAHPLPISALLLKELTVGLMMGFIAALAFDAMRIAGQLIDSSSGLTQASAMLPQLKAQESLSANLLYQLGVVFFLLTGGHRLFLAALVTSYQMLPPQQFPSYISQMDTLTFGLARLTADAITLGVLLAFPVIAAILLLNISLALVNKAAPQINVFFLGMPVKAALGAAILLVGLHVILDEFSQAGALSAAQILKFLELTRP